MYECAGAVPTLELTLNDPATRMQKCDALLYETAPSTAYPASYPVLRASDEDLSANPDVFEATDFGTDCECMCCARRVLTTSYLQKKPERTRESPSTP